GLEQFVGASLAQSTASVIDAAFLDPSNDGSGPAPRSITHTDSSGGAIQIASAGDARTDFEAMLAAYQGDLSRAALVMHPTTAVSLAFSVRDWGDTSIGIQGGRILGIPTLCSESAPVDSAGAAITLLDVGGLAAALS